MIKENSIKFTPTKSVGSVDVYRLQIVVHGALDVFNMRNPDKECWFELNTECDHVELKITDEVVKTGTLKELYDALLELCAMVFLLLPNTKITGMVRIEDGDYLHCVEADEAGLAYYSYRETEGGNECEWKELKRED